MLTGMISMNDNISTVECDQCSIVTLKNKHCMLYLTIKLPRKAEYSYRINQLCMYIVMLLKPHSH